MSCKIVVEPFSKVAGRKIDLLLTQDAASLEARVATSDTALNDDGIDKMLFAVYDPNSGYGEDLHSMTAFNTFCKSVDMQVNEVEDEKGKKWIFVDSQKMKIKRNGQEMTVSGSDIVETDEIVDYGE